MKTPLRESALLLLAWVLTASAGPLREVEITPDPAQGDHQVFTVRITPGETHVYEKMTFECTYHQEFTSQATESKGAKVIHEPESFTYRQRDVKLVDDLDTHVSFRVPISYAKLRDMFGLTAFNTNAPVTISRMTITAFTSEGKAWSVELAADGLHKFADTAPALSTNTVPAAKP